MLRSRVDTLLDPRKRLLVVGEMILDEFIWGKVSRISPEAPVPVVDVVEESWCAGGAANVARNVRALGAGVDLLSLAGVDHDGEVLRRLLTEAGIGLECVMTDAAYRTIRKTRIIARTQQVVRVDREAKKAFTDTHRATVLEKFEALLPQLDALIFEDYDKGLLDQALADALTQRARAAGKIVCVDPKPSNPVQWSGVTCVTPNRPEAFRCAGRLLSDPVDPPTQDSALREVGALLLEKWRCDFVLVTLSEQGMMLFEAGAEPYHIPTRAVEVFDVSGAGDTAIAAFTTALAGGASAREAADIANHASGIVVGKLGTAVVHREEVLESFAER